MGRAGNTSNAARPYVADVFLPALGRDDAVAQLIG
jgi:hypothetical protein